MKKTIIKVVVGAAALLLIALISIIGVFIYIHPSAGKEFEQIQCNGIIIVIDSISPCLSKIIVQQQKGTVDLKVNYCCGNKQGFFNFVSIGDSITKGKGKLVLVIINKKGETKTFDYPICFE